MIKISVIIAVYNAEKYLEQCIESIINQTYSNLEIIIVDDGSIDRSGLICDKYSSLDSRVIVLHQNNSGVIKARKNGYNKATGDYISWVDADDWLEPNMYEEFIRKMDKDVDVFIASFFKNERGIDERVEHIATSGVYTKKDNFELFLNQAMYTGHFFETGIYPALWNKLFKNSINLKNNIEQLPESITMGEDAALTYSVLAQSEKIQVCNELFKYHYRIVAESMSRNFDINYFKNVRTLINWIYENFCLGNKDRIKSVDYYCFNLIKSGIDLYSQKDYKYIFNNKRRIKKELKYFDVKKLYSTLSLDDCAVGMQLTSYFLANYYIVLYVLVNKTIFNLNRIKEKISIERD